jgi:hypothetical protein
MPPNPDHDAAYGRTQGESCGEAATRESRPEICFDFSVPGAKPHICGFFISVNEEYRLLLPFIKEGIELGEKVFHVVKPTMQDDHFQRLASVGINVAEIQQKGQLELCDWESAYFPDGRFDQNRMLAMWEDVLRGAVPRGFPKTRLVAHMVWALEDREGVSDLLEYEARFNLVHDERDLVICAYDLTKFKANVIIDVMRTHPMIIIGGILQENPFFVPPDEFVQELRQRQISRKLT